MTLLQPLTLAQGVQAATELSRSPADACFPCRNRRSVGFFVNTTLTNSKNSRAWHHRMRVTRRSLHR